MNATKQIPTGVATIERDHELLLAMVEMVQRTVLADDMERATVTLDRIIRLTESHSRDEEGFLRRCGYNNVLDLRRDHEMLIVYMEGLRAACADASPEELLERVAALSAFMVEHFAMEAEALRRFLHRAA